MTARFEIFEDEAGKFRFRFKAPNGEIVAESQGYETKASAEKGIQSIQTHAPNAVVETPHVSRLTLREDLSDCPSGNEHRLRVWATYTAADGLTVEGSDSTDWPCNDLTYTYHVAPEHIGALRVALGAADDDDLLELLKQRMPGLGVDGWLRKHGVQYTGSETQHPN